MPKGPPPPWTRRDCRFDHLITSAMKVGMGKAVYYRGIATPERAREIKNGIYRCARHRRVSAWVEWRHSGQWVTRSGMWPPDRQADGTYELRFTVAAKTQGRRQLLAAYGSDRSAWPYNPRQRKTEADIEAWAGQGLNGKGHRIR